MINLFTTFFNSENINRLNEYIYVLDKNINSNLFENIYLFSESDYPDEIKKYIDNNNFVKYINNKCRPTYKTIIDFINSNVYFEDSFNIISNSDIFFDDTIKLVKNIGVNDMYALSRWDYKNEYESILFNRIDSQDTWCFKGYIKDGMYCDFYFGLPGCDNRFAYECSKVGYDVSNPSKRIKTYHVHSSNYRTYNHNNIVEKPYLFVKPKT